MNIDKSLLNNPRLQALNIMKGTVPKSAWERNEIFTKNLRNKLSQHPINNHPAINALNSQKINKETLQEIHLDYRHAIVKVFTDALTMAMTQTRQLEPRLPAGAKLAPRFLLTLNALDEFGFRPELDSSNYYSGNPAFAHYPLYEDVLKELGLSKSAIEQFTPSQLARKLLHFLEASFSDYTSIITLLAVAELQVIIFSPPLRKATEFHSLDVNSGYYFVHGTSTDHDTAAADDDHEEDLWNALHQACTETDYNRLEATALEYMNLWNEFWNEQLSRINSKVAYNNSNNTNETTALA